TLTLNGTLILASTASLSGSVVVVNSTGIFNIGGLTVTPASLSLVGGMLVGGSAAVTAGTISSSTAFDLHSGTVFVPLAGNGGITKSTSGTVTLLVAPSTTGPVNINAGTLKLSSGLTNFTGYNTNLSTSYQDFFTSSTRDAGWKPLTNAAGATGMDVYTQTG